MREFPWWVLVVGVMLGMAVVVVLMQALVNTQGAAAPVVQGTPALDAGVALDLDVVGSTGVDAAGAEGDLRFTRGPAPFEVEALNGAALTVAVKSSDDCVEALTKFPTQVTLPLSEIPLGARLCVHTTRGGVATVVLGETRTFPVQLRFATEP